MRTGRQHVEPRARWRRAIPGREDGRPRWARTTGCRAGRCGSACEVRQCGATRGRRSEENAGAGVRWSCGEAEEKEKQERGLCVQHRKTRTRKHEGKREEMTGSQCRPWPSGHGALRDRSGTDLTAACKLVVVLASVC